MSSHNCGKLDALIEVIDRGMGVIVAGAKGGRIDPVATVRGLKLIKAGVKKIKKLYKPPG